MARIAYGDEHAAAFQASRHLADEGLEAWREAVERHLRPRHGTRLLDLGAGTGAWSRAFLAWFPGIEIVAVEPSPSMRSRWVIPEPGLQPVAGDAGAIPLPDSSVDGVWLSTVVHHIPDLAAAAREVTRVLRPGGMVLIRSVFAGRHQGINLFRYFPEAVRVVDSYPSVAGVQDAFGGFATVALEAVVQASTPSLNAFAAALSRAAHTPLLLISDEEYAAGLARLQAAARVESGPVVDEFDLLVLRHVL